MLLAACLAVATPARPLVAQTQDRTLETKNGPPVDPPRTLSAASEWIHRSGAVLDFGIAGGYREDRLDWNIAGDSRGQNPNVLSEIKWRNLEIGQLKLQSKLTLPQMFHFRGSFGYGWIANGDNRDSDYLGDGRTFEYSRTENNADQGSVYDFSVAAGYPFAFGREPVIVLRPLAGYSYHRQNLSITDGDQTVATPGLTQDAGPFAGLDSHYDARWYGPWIGVEVGVEAAVPGGFIQRVEGFFACELHRADYRAQADWNLRQDLAHPNSFRHRAEGVGWVLSGGFNLFVTPRWALTTEAVYQNWSTNQGRHRVYFSDGATADTQLNEVDWRSLALSVGLVYRF
jgi:outer membrane protease